jgi:hypothetical protein
MRWIADGQLQVLTPFPRMFETAMSYITLSHRQGRALRAWDAVHLCPATEWAREAATQVTILTGDSDFEEFLKLFPKIARLRRSRNDRTRITRRQAMTAPTRTRREPLERGPTPANSYEAFSGENPERSATAQTRSSRLTATTCLSRPSTRPSPRRAPSWTVLGRTESSPRCRLWQAASAPMSAFWTWELHKRLHTWRTLEIVQMNSKTKGLICGAFAEPSDGLEPSTPSLPWRCSTN